MRYAILMDLADIGGNVRDGVHVASIGGTWMAVTYGLAGMRDHAGMLSFDPRLPIQWEGLSFPLTIRGCELEVDLVHDRATYRLRKGLDLTLRHQGREVHLREGEETTLPIWRPEKRVPLTIEMVIPRDRFDAVLFDMDGVLTATAEVHAQAWKEMFDEFLKEREQRMGEPFRPFEIGTDYLLLVDGKPRCNGALDFLASRGIQLPEGSPEDLPSDPQVFCRFAHLQQGRRDIPGFDLFPRLFYRRSLLAAPLCLHQITSFPLLFQPRLELDLRAGQGLGHGACEPGVARVR